MSNLTDRVSYLKGLAEGMKLNRDKDQVKLLLCMLDMMGEMAAEIDKLSDRQESLSDYVDSIDDDLSDLEEALFGDDQDDGEDSGTLDEDDNAAGEEAPEELIEYECPNCGHRLQFTAEDVDFNEETLCPECGKPVFPELQEDEEDASGSEPEDPADFDPESPDRD